MLNSHHIKTHRTFPSPQKDPPALSQSTPTLQRKLGRGVFGFKIFQFVQASGSRKEPGEKAEKQELDKAKEAHILPPSELQPIAHPSSFHPFETTCLLLFSSLSSQRQQLQEQVPASLVHVSLVAAVQDSEPPQAPHPETEAPLSFHCPPQLSTTALTPPPHAAASGSQLGSWGGSWMKLAAKLYTQVQPRGPDEESGQGAFPLTAVADPGPPPHSC